MLVRSKRKATYQPESLSSASELSLTYDSCTCFFTPPTIESTLTSSVAAAMIHPSDIFKASSESSSTSVVASASSNANTDSNDSSNAKRTKLHQSTSSRSSVLVAVSTFAVESTASVIDGDDALTDLRITHRNHLSQLAVVEIQHIMRMLDTKSLLLLIRTSKGRLRSDSLHPVVWKDRHFKLSLAAIRDPQIKVAALNRCAYLPFCTLELTIDFGLPKPNNLLVPSTVTALFENLIAAVVALVRVDQVVVQGTTSRRLTTTHLQLLIGHLISSQHVRQFRIQFHQDAFLHNFLSLLVPIHRLEMDIRGDKTELIRRAYPVYQDSGLSVFVKEMFDPLHFILRLTQLQSLTWLTVGLFAGFKLSPSNLDTLFLGMPELRYLRIHTFRIPEALLLAIPTLKKLQQFDLSLSTCGDFQHTLGSRLDCLNQLLQATSKQKLLVRIILSRRLDTYQSIHHLVNLSRSLEESLKSRMIFLCEVGTQSWSHQLLSLEERRMCYGII